MPTFKSVWSNYPASDPCDAKDSKGQRLFKNQCAIRMSHALKGAGVNLTSFPAARKCWVHPKDHHILAARELANWLQHQPFSGLKAAEIVTGEAWREKVIDRTGIICFEDYYAADQDSGGDHIDLWNGSALTGLGSWMRARFGVVVPGFWSDFRKARQIRFFPLP